MANTNILPRTELEELKHQSGKVTDESLEITRHMVSMMEESEDAGKRTIESLDEQAEQIRRIESGMENINADMTRVENSLKSFKKCCNICRNPWKKEPNTDDSSLIESKNTNLAEGKIVTNQPRRGSSEKEIKSMEENSPPKSGYITRITNDDREDEMDANLCQVDSILSNLQNMAVDMGTELEKQNKQIEVINEMGVNNNIRLNDVNKQTNALIN